MINRVTLSLGICAGVSSGLSSPASCVAGARARLARVSRRLVEVMVLLGVTMLRLRPGHRASCLY